MVSKAPHFVCFLLPHKLLLLSLLCFTIFLCFTSKYQKAPKIETRPFIFTMHQSMNQLKKRSLETGRLHLPDNKNHYCLKTSATIPWCGPINFGAQNILYLVFGTIYSLSFSRKWPLKLYLFSSSVKPPTYFALFWFLAWHYGLWVICSQVHIFF